MSRNISECSEPTPSGSRSVSAGLSCNDNAPSAVFVFPDGTEWSSDPVTQVGNDFAMVGLNPAHQENKRRETVIAAVENPDTQVVANILNIIKVKVAEKKRPCEISTQGSSPSKRSKT